MSESGFRVTRRRLAAALCACGAAAAAWLPADPARAQGYPNHPVKLVVNFPPGGAADVLGRAVAQALSEQLSQQLVVENRPGANGNIGAEVVAKSPGDGYTLLMSSGGAMTVNPFIYKQMPFDAEKDLVPVAAVARVLVFLVVNPKVPATTVAEFVAYAKAHPGKLSYGSAGTGSSPHLAGEMFKRQAGFFATHIPYRGAAPALVDLLAGQIDFMFDPGPGLRHVKDGKLRLLAVGSPKRSPQVSDTPTLSEAGMAGFDADTVFGIYAPKDTPPDVVSLLHDRINQVLAAPKVLEVVNTIAGEALPLSREEFIGRQNADRERFGAFIRQAGIRAE